MTGIFGIDAKNKTKKMIYHFYGHYSSGKTTISRYLCRFALENGTVPIYFDTHGGLFKDDIKRDNIDETVLVHIPPLDIIDNRFSEKLARLIERENVIIVIDSIATLGQKGKTLLERLRGHIYDPATKSLLCDIFIMNNMRSTLHREGISSNSEFFSTIPYGWEYLHSFVDVTFKMSRNRISDDVTNVIDRIACKVVQTKHSEFKEGDIVYIYIVNGIYDDYRSCVTGAVNAGIVYEINGKFIVNDIVLTNSNSVYELARKYVGYGIEDGHENEN